MVYSLIKAKINKTSIFFIFFVNESHCLEIKANNKLTPSVKFDFYIEF